MLSGNHGALLALAVISQLTFLPLSASGSGTARVSPVSMFLMYIPFMSVYARYLPSGEIAPLVTRLSVELLVSCRSFRSGTDLRSSRRTLGKPENPGSND